MVIPDLYNLNISCNINKSTIPFLTKLTRLNDNNLFGKGISIIGSHDINNIMHPAIFYKPNCQEMVGDRIVLTGEALVKWKRIKYWSGPQ